jgi:hypothetical protein
MLYTISCTVVVQIQDFGSLQSKPSPNLSSGLVHFLTASLTGDKQQTVEGYGYAESTIENKIKFEHEEYSAEALSLPPVSMLRWIH